MPPLTSRIRLNLQQKIFLQQAIQERNKQQRITDLIPVTKLTLILVKSHVQSYLYS